MEGRRRYQRLRLQGNLFQLILRCLACQKNKVHFKSMGWHTFSPDFDTVLVQFHHKYVLITETFTGRQQSLKMVLLEKGYTRLSSGLKKNNQSKQFVNVTH